MLQFHCQVFDATADAIFGAVIGQSATLSYEYSPEGTASGKVKYTGEMHINFLCIE